MLEARDVRNRHRRAHRQHRGAQEGTFREQLRAAPVLDDKRHGRADRSGLGPHRDAEVGGRGSQVRPAQGQGQLLHIARHRRRAALRRARPLRPHAHRHRTQGRLDHRPHGVVRPSQPRLLARPRPRPGRDGGANTRRRDKDRHRARRADGHLLVPLGLLRLSGVVLRGAQRRDGALPLRLCAREARRRPRARRRLRHSGLGNVARPRLCARKGGQVRAPVRQVHAHVGAQLHAERPEAARARRGDEAHHDPRAHQGPPPRLLRRLHRQGNAARQAG